MSCLECQDKDEIRTATIRECLKEVQEVRPDSMSDPAYEGGFEDACTQITARLESLLPKEPQ